MVNVEEFNKKSAEEKFWYLFEKHLRYLAGLDKSQPLKEFRPITLNKSEKEQEISKIIDYVKLNVKHKCH